MYRKDSESWLKHADLLVIFCYGTMKGILKKGYYRDFVVTLKHSIMVGGLAILYLFLLQQGHIKNRKGENLSLLI